MTDADGDKGDCQEKEAKERSTKQNGTGDPEAVAAAGVRSPPQEVAAAPSSTTATTTTAAAPPPLVGDDDTAKIAAARTTATSNNNNGTAATPDGGRNSGAPPPPPPSVAPFGGVGTGGEQDDDEAQRQVKIHLVAVGSAPILKKSKFQIAANRSFASLGTTVARLIRKPSVFLYCNSAFVPPPEALLGELHECFQIRDELVVHYSLQEAWG